MQNGKEEGSFPNKVNQNSFFFFKSLLFSVVLIVFLQQLQQWWCEVNPRQFEVLIAQAMHIMASDYKHS